MKAITNRKLYRLLDRTVAGWRDIGGWTYNVFCNSPQLRLSERVGMKHILAATRTAVNCLAAPEDPLIIFHDGLAAWRTKPKRIRAYELSPNELERFILHEVCFRDPAGFSDNYNIMNEAGGWMITFCHENDWFLFAPSARITQLRKKIKAEPAPGTLR